MTARTADSLSFAPDTLLKGALRLPGDSALAGATRYETAGSGDGIEYRFPKGTLCAFGWLSTDLLVEGNQTAVLIMKLREGEAGPEFGLVFSTLNQCQARLRFPLWAVNQNVWALGREQALFKRICVGQRVDLENVDRIQLCLERHGPKPSRWSMTALTATTQEPPLLQSPLLPAGPLLDELGQSTLHDWNGKTPSESVLADRLSQQFKDAATAAWPEGFSRFGGCKDKRFDATGYFRTQHDGRRWWLVDPDGCAFWSAGQDCVNMHIESAIAGIHQALKWIPNSPDPDYANFLIANFRRVFGDSYYENWSRIALGFLKHYGFNTVANWSDWRIAQQAGFPYVRPMEFHPTRTACIYRDFPDAFAPSLQDDARDYAQQLREHQGDRAFIGYFLMNEPTWGFASDTPAEGMLFNTESCHCREALADSLEKQYGTDPQLQRAWGMNTSFAQVRRGKWHGSITEACRRDLAAFSTVMVDRYFSTLSVACKSFDPDHLNLGARYYTVPPQWALLGMKSFDVFSINCYRQRVPADQLQAIADITGKPTLIGEWHFGALDVGLPSTGIGFVATQADRGKAYRVYLETAAAIPNCVGVHYFTLYDQSAVGRSDGENYNIGFLDVCNRPYEPLCNAAREAHRRMYAVAGGQLSPYSDAPEYFPPLFT